MPIEVLSIQRIFEYMPPHSGEMFPLRGSDKFDGKNSAFVVLAGEAGTDSNATMILERLQGYYGNRQIFAHHIKSPDGQGLFIRIADIHGNVEEVPDCITEIMEDGDPTS